MERTIEQYFADWFGSVFPYGYGTGEEFVIPALKGFMGCCARPDGSGSLAYRHETLEAKLGPAVAWLMINALCQDDILNYGTSPRYGWLTEAGALVHEFVSARTVDELYDIVMAQPTDDFPFACDKETCNCGPNGYEKGRLCPNPFFGRRGEATQ